MHEKFDAWTTQCQYGRRISNYEEDNLYHQIMDFTISQFTLEVKAIVEGFDSTARTVNLEIWYVESLSFNAHVASSNEADMIAINAGSLYWITELLSRISKISSCLLNNVDLISPSDLPDWPKKTEISLVPNGFGPMKNLPLNSLGPLFHNIAIAMRYLMHHELAHIWNGHLEWKSQFNKQEFINNLGNLKINKSLEFDADSRAGWAARNMEIESVFKEIAAAGVSHSAPHFCSYQTGLSGVCTLEVNLHRYVTTIYLTIRLQIYFSGPLASSLAYPHPLYRLIWFIEGCLSAIGFASNQIPQTIMKIIISAVHAAEQAFCLVTKDTYLDIFEKNLINNATECALEIKNTWNASSDMIRPYNRGYNLWDYDISTSKSSRNSILKNMLLEMGSVPRGAVKPIHCLDVNLITYGNRLNYNLNVVFNSEDNAEYYSFQGKISDEFDAVSKSSYDIIETDQNNEAELWIKYLIDVNCFMSKMRLVSSYSMSKWLKNINTVIKCDALLAYVIGASSLNTSEARKCLSQSNIDGFKRVMPRYNGKNLFDTIGSSDKKKIITYIVDFKSDEIDFYAPTHQFTQCEDISIKELKIAVAAIMPFFLFVNNEINKC